MILKDDIYGLILAGGKSSRMQTDKGELQYHDAMSQRTFLYKMLQKFCAKTFISCRKDQAENLQSGEACIVDENMYEGPLNGILSAHHRFPQVAWLVLAVDLPHLTDKTIQVLLDERDTLKAATAYSTQTSQMPEPLIAIWEPVSLAAVICNTWFLNLSATGLMAINSFSSSFAQLWYLCFTDFASSRFV